MTTKVNKKTENRSILEKLVQNAVIDYEDGCVGVEVENDTHYLYMYDDFQQEENSSHYYFARVIVSGKHYEPIELSESEKDFLKNELFKVWQPSYREEQYQKKRQQIRDNIVDNSWVGWAEKEFTYDDFMKYKFG